MIKSLYYFVLLMALFSCSNSKKENKYLSKNIELSPQTFENEKENTITNEISTQHKHSQEYLKVYIVVVDTSQKYFKLRQKMIGLNDKLNLKIDTLGRGFNTKKNKICLPDDDKDEIYAGDYFPREGLSATLSIEYLDYFEKNTGRKTMALFAGIFSDKNMATIKHKAVKTMYATAYILETEIYLGCKH